MDPIIQQPSQPTGADPLAALTPGTPGVAGEPEEQPSGATVEERDAYWRKRMSGKDRAHAAAEQALRDEIASLKAPKPKATGTDGQPGSDAEVARLQQENENLRTIFGRKTKYPNLNGKVSDAIIAAADEAELARLNALFDDSGDAGGTFIAPTAPRREAPQTGKKPYSQMTKQELEIELQRESARLVEDRQAGF